MLADLGALVDLIEAPGWGLDDAIQGWHGPMLLHNLDYSHDGTSCLAL